MLGKHHHSHIEGAQVHTQDHHAVWFGGPGGDKVFHGWAEPDQTLDLGGFTQVVIELEKTAHVTAERIGNQ